MLVKQQSHLGEHYVNQTVIPRANQVETQPGISGNEAPVGQHGLHESTKKLCRIETHFLPKQFLMHFLNGNQRVQHLQPQATFPQHEHAADSDDGATHGPSHGPVINADVGTTTIDKSFRPYLQADYIKTVTTRGQYEYNVPNPRIPLPERRSYESLTVCIKIELKNSREFGHHIQEQK